MTSPRRYSRSSMAADLCLTVAWLIVCTVTGLLVSYRALLHSSIADLLDFRDVPLLWMLKSHYRDVFLALLFGNILLLALVILRLHRAGTRQQPHARIHSPAWRYGFMLAMFAYCLSAAWANRCSIAGGQFAGGQHPTGVFDWTLVALQIPIGWSIAVSISSRLGTDENLTGLTEAASGAAHGTSRIGIVRLSIVYLLGLAAIVLYGVFDHISFWDSARNGGFEFHRFFADGESRLANRVLFSTTVLFASLAAVLGCIAFVSFRLLTRSAGRPACSIPRQIRSCSLLIATGWTLFCGVPWQSRILTEIRAERGWILPALVLSGLAATLLPLASITVTALLDDLRPSRGAAGRPTRLSTILLCGCVLFPVYPGLRLVLPRRLSFLRPTLMVLACGLIVAFILGVNFLDEWFEFEDWRGMLRQAQLPALEVYFSLLGSFLLYVLIQSAASAGSRMIASWRDRWPAVDPISSGIRSGLAALLMAAAVLCLITASFPFWGWHGISENVFARLNEFHGRYRFEHQSLQSLFDLDRDGYAAVLRGADADDWNPHIQAAGLPAPQTVALPLDHFTVRDRERAEGGPNVLILYLEGVIPRALSCYGKRNLPGDLVATPHIDSVAADGTLFTQARVYYPSTWDAWFAVNSGRFLHISEMNNSLSFGNRYSRYNNLYRALRLAGIDRWCHADCSCYAELFVPEAVSGTHSAWSPPSEASTALSTREVAADVWSGDKRNERILEFLDSVLPGQRFFICEHMSDSHFPWRETSDERAREMGFPNGLSPYGRDARLPWQGTFNGKYARYLQTVTRVDWQVGQILEKLKQRGLYDNTLIVIMSDHGCQWWEHEHLYYVSHLYEQCLHVPLIIRTPDGCRGHRVDDPVLQTDILPTILELFGIEHDRIRSQRPLPGVSLACLLNGSSAPNVRERLWNRDVPLRTHYDTIGLLADFRYKLIFDRTAGCYWLFDLKEDPREMHNLADAAPRLLNSLKRRLREYARAHPEFLGEIQRGPQAGSSPSAAE